MAWLVVFYLFWTVAGAVRVKGTELAVHALLMSFAVVTELVLIATNKKLVNDGVVVVLINNSTQLDAPVFLYGLLSLVWSSTPHRRTSG